MFLKQLGLPAITAGFAGDWLCESTVGGNGAGGFSTSWTVKAVSEGAPTAMAV